MTVTQGHHESSVSMTMSHLAQRLRDGHKSVEATVQAITASAIAVVPGAAYAGVSLGRKNRKVENRAASDPVVEYLDEMQAAENEGPCLDALRDEHTVRIVDVATETRWPRFTARASEVGIASMIAFRLSVTPEGTLGVLNLYGTTPHAFDKAAEDIGLVVAAHAAVALVGAQHESTLMVALSSRDIIGQAKGILMERYKITAVDAFLLLARTSQEVNIPVSVLADTLTAHGTFD